MALGLWTRFGIFRASRRIALVLQLEFYVNFVDTLRSGFFDFFLLPGSLVSSSCLDLTIFSLLAGGFTGFWLPLLVLGLH